MPRKAGPTAPKTAPITIPRKSVSTSQARDRLFSIIGIVVILGLLCLIIFLPQPTAFQFFVIRITLALASGFATLFLTGTINLHLKNGGLIVRATGSLAIVVMVYAFTPTISDSARRFSGHNTTFGDRSPIIDHNTGSITIK
jgi:hypothetical protein